MQKNSSIVGLYIVPTLLCLCVIFSCAHKSGHKGNVVRNAYSEKTSYVENANDERKVRGHTKVRMEKAGGVYLVPIKVNGLDLKFIFDTGASSICLSSAEALVLLRQGQITQDDFVGQQQFQDATGGISVGTIIRLHTVEIGGILLRNVEANVVDNIQAPLLLGQTALSKFGKVTIDYNNNIIEFN